MRGEFLRFLVVGVASVVMDCGILYFATEVLGVPYLWSSAISFSLSFIFNYWANVVWVFAAGHQTTRQVCLFIVSSLAGLGLNQVVMWLSVEMLGIYYMFAKLAATGLVSLWNFFSRRMIMKS